MTDVESDSTVPSNQRKGRLRRAALAVGTVVTVLAPVLVASPRPAAADSLTSARGEAAHITAQLAADQQHLDAVSQTYDAAQQRVTQVNQQIVQIKATVAQDHTQVAQDRANLRNQALTAYMTGSAADDVDAMFSSSGEKGSAASEYRSVATGDISGAIDSLTVAQTHLADEQSQLEGAQNAARAALAQADSARQAAEATVADQEATLGRLKGRIATLVSERQAAQQQASHSAFVARLHGTPLPALPAAGAAARAIGAAESQLGVPYRWGGESPGSGFDCSGLTQWAWGQAGVGLPRTAAAQYAAIAHVPLSAMEPGDLVFWGGGGGIYHVGIYVGGGNVLDAPSTGQVVQVQPIWNSGLAGAGRP